MSTTYELSLQEWIAVLAVRVTTSILSLLGSLFIVFSILVFKGYKTRANRLILSLTISGVVTSVINLVSLNLGPEPQPSGVCTFQGIIMHFSQMASFAWVLLIAFNMWMLVIMEKRDHQLKRWEIGYHIFGWGSALLFTILPGTTNSYGPAGAWCWINSENDLDQAWRFAAFYIPLYIYIVLTIIAYVMAHKTFNLFAKHKSDKIRKGDRRTLFRLAAFPIIFLVLWIFPTVNRLHNWIVEDYDVFPLYILQVLTAPLQGFVNAFAFGFDKEIKMRWKKLLYQYVPCLFCGNKLNEKIERYLSKVEKEYQRTERSETVEGQEVTDASRKTETGEIPISESSPVSLPHSSLPSVSATRSGTAGKLWKSGSVLVAKENAVEPDTEVKAENSEL